MSRPTPDPSGADPDHDRGSAPHAAPSESSASLPERGTERRTAWLAGIGVLVLLIGLYAAAVVVAGDRVPAGTRVADVRIGGLSQQAAADRLREELLPGTDDAIEVSIADRPATIDPIEAGLSVDVEATVDRAGGGTMLDPRTLWDAFFGGDEVAPVVRTEQQRLIGTLRELADRTALATVEPSVTFDGARPVVHRPQDGLELEVGPAAVAILDAWLVDDDTIELPVAETEPSLGADALRDAMEQARTIVSRPVTLELPGREVRLDPERYAPAVSVRPVDGELDLVVDRELLTKRLRRVIAVAQQPPEDATVRLVSGRPQVVPAQAGLEVEPQTLVEAVVRAATAEGERSARLTGNREPADFTTKDARGLEIDEPVSSFTTAYPHAAYRNTNIGRAADLINGTVLRPGQIFSLNDTVGERTVANGFTEGFVISNGIYAEDLGGGVSQVATTVFNAAFFAGLEDVEHKPHSFFIDRYPEGREATVAWPDVDLSFRNDTPHGVLIETWIDPSAPGGSGEMHARMWSTKYWDIEARKSGRYDFTTSGTQTLSGPECVPTEGYGGFEVDVYRDFYRVGSSEKERTETFHTTYAPLDTVICT